MNRKSYDIKFFGGIEFEDYWNLQEHPLYVCLNKKQKPYFTIRESAAEGYERVDSLQSLANYMRRYDWPWEDKYWNVIKNHVQAAINIPYTNL